MRLDWVGSGCSLVAILVYFNTLDAQFVYDDTRAILQNTDIQSHAPLSNLLLNDFWGTPLSHSGSHKSYRPLTTFTFKLNYMLGGGFKPFSYHLTNTLLHGLVTYFFVILVKTFTHAKNEKCGTTWMAGLLFAVHPIHTEAVAGIVGRADILCALFFILALLEYRNHIGNNDSHREGGYWCQEYAKREVSHNINNNSNYSHVKHKAWMDHEYKCRDKNGNVYLSERKKRHHSSASSSSSSSSSVSSTTSNLYDFLGNAQLYQGEKFHLSLTLLLAGCAMLCKEQGITVLGVCFLLDLLEPKQNGRRSRQRRSLIILILGTIALMYLRAMAMSYSTPMFAKADNPAASNDSWLTRFLTFVYLPIFNLLLMACPVSLSFDWSMDAIPLISSLSDPRNLTSLLGYALLGTVSVKNVILPVVGAVQDLFRGKSLSCDGQPHYRMATIKEHHQVTGFSLILMVLPFLPATNLLFYVGFVVAERILYVPSLGFCLLSAHCVETAFRRLRRHIPRKMGWALQAICCSLLLISSGLKTWTRNLEWKDEESLYRAGLKINPAKAFGNLANVLTQRGKVLEAETAFKAAIFHRPNMADAHYNLGVLYQREGNITQAIDCYKKAIHFRPKLTLAHLNLGLAYSSLGHKDASLKILEGILHIDDDGLKDPKTHANTQISAMYNMGMILLELGKASEAIPVLRRAETLGRPSQYEHIQGVLHLLGEAYQAVNQTTQAEYWYQAATSYTPAQVPAFIKYGKMLAKNKTRLTEAEEWFAKAKTIAPQNPSVHLHLGLFLMDADRNLEAANHFEIASNLDPFDYESAFNAAVAFRLTGQNHQAEQFYRKAIDIRPKDPSSHMNLGAMLHLVGKLTEAEDHYLKAWQLRPGDAATKTNIQRLHNIMRGRGLPVQSIDLH